MKQILQICLVWKRLRNTLIWALLVPTVSLATADATFPNPLSMVKSIFPAPVGTGPRYDTLTWLTATLPIQRRRPETWLSQL